jgi:hypothetical protein
MCFNLNLFNLCLSTSNNNTNTNKNTNNNNNSNISEKSNKSSSKLEKNKSSASKVPANNNSTISITTNLIATANSEANNNHDSALKAKSVALDLASTLFLDSGFVAEREQDLKKYQAQEATYHSVQNDNDYTGQSEKVVKRSDSAIEDKYFANYWNYSNLSYSELYNITIDEILSTIDHTNLLASSSLSTFSSLSPSLLSNSSSPASVRENTNCTKFIKMNTDKIENTTQSRPTFNIPFGQNGSFLNINTNANGFSSVSPISPSRPTIGLGSMNSANNNSLTGLNRPFINLNSNAPKANPFEFKMNNLNFKKQAYTFTSDQLLPKSNDQELSFILDENLNNLRLDDNNNLNNSFNAGCNSSSKGVYEKKSQSGRHHSYHHHHHDKPKSAGGKIRISPNQVTKTRPSQEKT